MNFAQNGSYKRHVFLSSKCWHSFLTNFEGRGTCLVDASAGEADFSRMRAHSLTSDLEENPWNIGDVAEWYQHGSVSFPIMRARLVFVNERFQYGLHLSKGGSSEWLGEV